MFLTKIEKDLTKEIFKQISKMYTRCIRCLRCIRCMYLKAIICLNTFTVITNKLIALICKT